MIERETEREPLEYFEFSFSSKLTISDPIRDYVDNDTSLKDYSFRYEATYLGEETLTVRPIADDTNGESILLACFQVDPWDIFHKHASFDDILRGCKGEDVLLSQPHSLQYNEYSASAKELKTRMTEDVKIHYEKMFSLYDPPTMRKSDKKLLSTIKDVPYLLYDKDILKRFIEIVTTARWNLDKSKSDMAKHYLDAYFLPKHGGGKRPLPNINFNLAVKLVKKLSQHLSEKCRKVLTDNKVYISKDDWKFTDETCDVCNGKGSKTVSFNKQTCRKCNGLGYVKSVSYDVLNKWIEKAVEYRLSSLPKESLSTLVLKPLSFANQLIEESLNISLKTLSRNIDN
ncbi:MAG: hypothetical protein A2132_06240 [Nitrospirae bacterium RBG_16_43_11]|nr:MAG: hypothetical protein A2132_06240 [Nitrospirae bacterium RBG_16_43_11]